MCQKCVILGLDPGIFLSRLSGRGSTTLTNRPIMTHFVQKTRISTFCIYRLAPIGRGRRRLPLGRPRAVWRASPGKRVQIASMQFGPVSFLQKLTCHFAKTYRALHGAICFTKGANCLEAGRLPGSGRRGLTIQCAPREGNKILLLYTSGSHAHHHGLLRKEEEDYKRYGNYKGSCCKVGELVLFVGDECEESQCQGLLSR